MRRYLHVSEICSAEQFVYRDDNVVISLDLSELGQERETYRYPVKESVKSMLAMGWTIERTKGGEAMFQQREAEKQLKISEASQVERFNMQ